MPFIVDGDKTSEQTSFESIDHHYEYPDGLDLKPGSEFHKKIVSKILSRARESAGIISKRHGSWNNIDRVLTTYVGLDEKEKAIKKKDERKPVSIVFPYSYTILETLLGYLSAAFFQEPIFRFEGVSPEDIIGTIMMEKIVDLQCNKAKVALELHTMFRDGLSYGMGIAAPTWVKQHAMKTIKQDTGILSSITGLFRKTGFEKGLEETLVFEGNKLNNIDPYLALPDPNVPAHKIQDGEFFGWVDRTNYMDLLSEEKHSEGDMFNVKYIRNVHNKQSSIWGEDKSERERKALDGTSRYSSAGVMGRPAKMSGTTNAVDVINMYIKIIPKEWELGSGEYPEKWYFRLAADDVLVNVKPLNLDHDMFPATVCAPDFDGYSPTPISRLEKLYGLQGTLDWLFNMHIANVRKAINDMLVYDPYLINSNDLKKPGPGKLIRMRRPAWGRGVKDAVMQLAVTDVTRQHISDSTFIVQWMDKIGAANEAVQGGLRSGGPERLTAKEFTGAQAGAFSRLERIAKIIGLQSMQDLGYMFASHTQQLMEEETYVKASGRWEQTLMSEFGVGKVKIQDGRMKVSPFDILVNYDMKVRDGSIPGGNFSDVWIRMFDTLAQHPELTQQFDIVRIFKHIARNSGAKNVDDFVKINVLPDEEIVNQVDKGNIVPTEDII